MSKVYVRPPDVERRVLRINRRVLARIKHECPPTQGRAEHRCGARPNATRPGPSEAIRLNLTADLTPRAHRQRTGGGRISANNRMVAVRERQAVILADSAEGFPRISRVIAAKCGSKRSESSLSASNRT